MHFKNLIKCRNWPLRFLRCDDRAVSPWSDYHLETLKEETFTDQLAGAFDISRMRLQLILQLLFVP